MTQEKMESFQLPRSIKDQLRERCRKNGKKLYFYASQLIQAGLEREDLIAAADKKSKYNLV